MSQLFQDHIIAFNPPFFSSLLTNVDSSKTHFTKTELIATMSDQPSLFIPRAAPFNPRRPVNSATLNGNLIWERPRRGALVGPSHVPPGYSETNETVDSAPTAVEEASTIPPETSKSEDKPTCIVCQEPYNTGLDREAPVTLECGHTFGSLCISRWIHVRGRENGCPMVSRISFAISEDGCRSMRLIFYAQCRHVLFPAVHRTRDSDLLIGTDRFEDVENTLGRMEPELQRLRASNMRFDADWAAHRGHRPISTHSFRARAVQRSQMWRGPDNEQTPEDLPRVFADPLAASLVGDHGTQGSAPSHMSATFSNNRDQHEAQTEVATENSADPGFRNPTINPGTQDFLQGLASSDDGRADTNEIATQSPQEASDEATMRRNRIMRDSLRDFRASVAREEATAMGPTPIGPARAERTINMMIQDALSLAMENPQLDLSRPFPRRMNDIYTLLDHQLGELVNQLQTEGRAVAANNHQLLQRVLRQVKMRHCVTIREETETKLVTAIKSVIMTTPKLVNWGFESRIFVAQKLPTEGSADWLSNNRYPSIQQSMREAAGAVSGLYAALEACWQNARSDATTLVPNFDVAALFAADMAVNNQ